VTAVTSTVEPRNDLIEAVGYSLACFVGRYGDEPPKCLGSGTFVRYGRVFGVLTCAHVWELVRDWKQAGEEARRVDREKRKVSLLGFTIRGNGQTTQDFYPDTLAAVKFGQEPWTVRGPDLAFVRLPASSESHFQSVSIVRDLQRHWELLVSGAFNDARSHCVAGVVDEWVTPGASTANANTMNFPAYISWGKVRRRLSVADGHNKYIYVPRRLGRTPLPTSFEGTSGAACIASRSSATVITVSLKSSLTASPRCRLGEAR